jgi:putative exosortase-associated protein (TIGR04073 family)
MMRDRCNRWRHSSRCAIMRAVRRLMLLAILLAMLEPAPAAAEESVPGRIGHKLVRGVVNLGTGWLEMPKQIYRKIQEEGALRGVLLGPIEGLGMAIVRSTAGAYEIVTFPLPIPPGYEPMFQPEYIWQRDPAETDAFLLIPPPNAEEGR